MPMETLKYKISKFFEDVKFTEENHQYKVGGSPLSSSVSGKIKDLVPHVNFDEIALRKDTKLGFPLGTHKSLWKNNSDLACAKGNKAHFFGEIYAFNRNLKPTDGYEVAIKKFWDELPKFIIPLFTELVMYHKDYMFGGTADIICLDTRDNSLIIMDYKTNSELYKHFKNNTLKAPFKFLDETNFSKYELQFSFYQILLEQVPGVKIKARRLVWIKDDGSYELLKTIDYTEHLKKYMNENY